MTPAKRAAYKKKKARDQLGAYGHRPGQGLGCALRNPSRVRTAREGAASGGGARRCTSRRTEIEGEAIAWHRSRRLAVIRPLKRVVFNEITKRAIEHAFSEPGDVDVDRVNAQQARRFLDRVVGYMVSLLWSKAGRGLSAGRAQSVAARDRRARAGDSRFRTGGVLEAANRAR